MMQLSDVLQTLSARRAGAVVVAAMTSAYAWPAVSRDERDFGYIAPMGSAAAVGLGLALARPDVRVWVLDGDGSLLMNLGVLVTIAAQRPANLVHMVMNNGVYAITGGQKVPGSGVADFAAMARGAGIQDTHTIVDAGQFAGFVDRGLRRDGPVFADIHVEPAYDRAAVPALTHAPQALRTQGGPGFHNLRKLLAASR